MENEFYGFVYITTNLINGKKYIGQKSYTSRKVKSYLGSGIELKKAINKYGEINFRRDIVENCETREQLNEREIYWISFYNAITDPLYYNIASGGDGGNVLGGYTDEQRIELSKKLSKIRKGNVNLGGKNGGAKKVICLNNMEIFDSGADAARKYNICPECIYTCCKKGITKTAGINPENGERLQWEFYHEGNTYEFIPYVHDYAYAQKRIKNINTNEIFSCAKEASERYGVSTSTISTWCKGKYKKPVIDSETNIEIILKYYDDI